MSRLYYTTPHHTAPKNRRALPRCGEGGWLRACWLSGGLAGWLARWLAGSLAGCGLGWVAGTLLCLVALWLLGLQAAWLAGWRTGCLAVSELAGLLSFFQVCCAAG